MKTDRGERTLTGLAISPGIAIGPAFISDDGAIQVPEYAIAHDDIAAEQQALRRRGVAVAETAREAQDQGRGAARRRRRGGGLSARRACRDADQFAAGARRRPAHRRRSRSTPSARCRSNWADRLELRRDGRRLSRGARRRYPRRRRAADPQPDQDALRRRCNGCAPGTIIVAEELTPADTALIDPRTVVGARHRTRRRRGPYRDHGARPRPAGGAGRRRSAAPGRAGRHDHRRWRHGPRRRQPHRRDPRRL